jgi:hypothetical protein
MVVKVFIDGSSWLSPSPAGDAPARSLRIVSGGAVFYLVQRKKTIGKHFCRPSLNPLGSIAFCALYILPTAQ